MLDEVLQYFWWILWKHYLWVGLVSGHFFSSEYEPFHPCVSKHNEHSQQRVSSCGTHLCSIKEPFWVPKSKIASVMLFDEHFQLSWWKSELSDVCGGCGHRRCMQNDISSGNCSHNATSKYGHAYAVRMSLLLCMRNLGLIRHMCYRNHLKKIEIHHNFHNAVSSMCYGFGTTQKHVLPVRIYLTYLLTYCHDPKGAVIGMFLLVQMMWLPFLWQRACPPFWVPQLFDSSQPPVLFEQVQLINLFPESFILWHPRVLISSVQCHFLITWFVSPGYMFFNSPSLSVRAFIKHWLNDLLWMNLGHHIIWILHFTVSWSLRALLTTSL